MIRLSVCSACGEEIPADHASCTDTRNGRHYHLGCVDVHGRVIAPQLPIRWPDGR